MLELHDKAYKFTIKMFLEEVRTDVKDIRKEVNELKVSVNFANANYVDIQAWSLDKDRSGSAEPIRSTSEDRRGSTSEIR